MGAKLDIKTELIPFSNIIQFLIIAFIAKFYTPAGSLSIIIFRW